MKRSPKQRPTGGTRISEFAHQLLLEWQRLELPSSNETVVVAVSGGADSTALLLALKELEHAGRISLRIVVGHLDHGLRDESRKDAEWVSELAGQLGYEAVCGRAQIAQLARTKFARTKADNLEQAAREARYEFLIKTARNIGAHMVLTAHTMDDQAETFLLRLLRGSGAEGLSGIEPIRLIAPGTNIKLVRPLVTWARKNDTEAYCRKRRVEFRTDEMNEDEKFARVRVRKQLLPLMQSFNGRIVETLDRTANLLREDANTLSCEAIRLLNKAEDLKISAGETEIRLLNVKIIAEAPPAVRWRVIREWITRAYGNLKRFERVHILAVDKLLLGNKGGRVAELPNGVRIIRKRNWLELHGKRS